MLQHLFVESVSGPVLDRGIKGLEGRRGARKVLVERARREPRSAGVVFLVKGGLEYVANANAYV